MGRERYSVRIGDPHIAFDATWHALDEVQGISRVDEFLVREMDVYSQGSYHSVPAFCMELFQTQPTVSYPRCIAAVNDLSSLLQDGGGIIKVHNGDATALLALSSSQARVLRSGILHSDMSRHLATLNRSLIALEDAIAEQSKLESLVEDEVPKEKPLYLLGSCRNENFRYTVSRYGDRLGHDLVTLHKPLHAVAQELEGNALYQVRKIPSFVSQKIDDFRRFLLSQYISIKRQISRENLQHYPLLFENAG